MDDAALFDAGESRRHRGRARRGLDADIAAARASGTRLPGDLVAVARILADALDALDALTAGSRKPYDRVPLATLAQRYLEARGELFGVLDDADPFDRLVSDLVRAESDPARPHAAGP